MDLSQKEFDLQDQDQMKQLVEQYRQDGSNFDLIVLGHARLTRYIARKFSKRYHLSFYWEEEANSLAYELLCSSVYKARTSLYDNNITFYITECITQGLKSLFGQMVQVEEPKDSVLEPRDIDNIAYEEGEEETSAIHDDHTFIVDDLIDHIARNDRDKEILQYMLQGYTLQEIGDVYGLTRQAISLVLLDLKVRAKEYYNVKDLQGRADPIRGDQSGVGQGSCLGDDEGREVSS